MRTPSLAAALLICGVGSLTAATIIESKKTVTEVETPFDKGKLELQSSTGAYFSIGSGNRPTLNYTSTAYRLGIMLHDPAGDGWLRGNSELLIQVLYGSVFDGPGDYLAGGTILWRYNFVQPDSRWVPYFQLGVGAVFNDIHKDYSQRLIGQEWEFDVEAALGVRYFFNDRWSGNLEGGYRHISNAGLNDRNVGLNSLGATIGLGCHF
jgi:opacity protein-like surface antigen